MGMWIYKDPICVRKVLSGQIPPPPLGIAISGDPINPGGEESEGNYSITLVTSDASNYRLSQLTNNENWWACLDDRILTLKLRSNKNLSLLNKVTVAVFSQTWQVQQPL